MAFGFMLAGGALSLVSVYLCFLAPGQAWWNGHGSSIPRLFSQIALSVLWTTLVGLGLAISDSFHFPLIILINSAVTLFGYLYVGLPRRETSFLAPNTATAGLLIALLALSAYWPSYDTRFAASDSTSYTSAGVHLARAHTIWKHDDVGEQLQPQTRKGLFRSVFGYLSKPPFSRILGGLVVQSPDDHQVRPSFFPAAIVWSAIFSEIFSPRHAGGYAGTFCALAVWGMWIVARRRLGPVAAMTVTGLVAANGAAYYAGRLPLSEPIAWFFAWAALAALDAWEDDGFSADALVAGLMLGALAVIRPEFALFTVSALCIRHVMAFSFGTRPFGPSFVLGFAIMTIAAVIEVRYLRGAYLAPIEEILRAIGWQISELRRGTPAQLQAAAIAGAIAIGGAGLWMARKIGFTRVMAFMIPFGFVALYCIESTPRPARSLTWLVSFLGYVAPILALLGIAVAWRQRGEVRGNSFLLVLSILVSGLLIYNTHVNPALPWAIRRFVPIVIPAVILFAGLFANSLYRRSPLVGFACWIVLAGTILVPASALYGQQFHAGSEQQLHKFVQELPTDGVYLIDDRLAPLLLGIPLWLLYDIDNLPANLNTQFLRRTVYRAIRELRVHRPVYYVRPTPAAADPLAAYNRELITDYTFQIPLMEQTQDRMPTAIVSYTTTVSVFRIGTRKPPAAAAP
jgi:hypothetical protein